MPGFTRRCLLQRRARTELGWDWGNPHWGNLQFRQSTFGQPTLGQPTLRQSTFGQPTLRQPTMRQSTSGHPTLRQSTLRQTAFKRFKRFKRFIKPVGKADDPCQLQDHLHADDRKSIEVNGHLLGIGAPKPIQGNTAPIPSAPDIKPHIPTPSLQACLIVRD